MDSTSFDDLTEDLLGRARAAHSGRAAHTVFGGTGHLLRQTAIALLAGAGALRAQQPGRGDLHVLHGRVRLSSASRSIEASAGDFVTIPPERHALPALEDAVVLLSVVAR